MTEAVSDQGRDERPPVPPPPQPVGAHQPHQERHVGLLAPIGRRALGRIIDTVLVAIPFVVLASRYVTIHGDKVSISQVPAWFAVAWQGAAVVYETLLLTWRGQTVGKVVAGTRVDRVDGGNPHWWQAALRIGIPSLAFLIPYVGGGLLAVVVYLTAIWHPYRQGWHDRAAGTVVVTSR